MSESEEYADTVDRGDAPISTREIAEGLRVEEYDDCVRVVQVVPDQFLPETLIVPNEQAEAVADAMTDLAEAR